MKEKKINSKEIFKGNVIKVTLDSVEVNNRKSKREVVHHLGGVAIILIKDDEILFEKQFRYAINEIVYEIPAGKLEKNEEPYQAACRELEEETSFKPKKLIELGYIYPTFGYSNEPG